MNRRSSEIVHFLLVIVCLYCRSVFGADGSCDFNSTIANCFDNRNYMSEPMKIATIFRVVNRSISQTCSRMDVMKTCVKNAMARCPPEDKNPFNLIWPKAEIGIKYVCEDKVRVFTEKRECLARQATISSTAPCQDKLNGHSAKRRYARHSCSDFQAAVKCVKDAIDSHCGSDAAVIMERMARIMLGLNHPSHDCDQHSSGTVLGVSSLVLSTAFISSFLQKYPW